MAVAWRLQVGVGAVCVNCSKTRDDVCPLHAKYLEYIGDFWWTTAKEGQIRLLHRDLQQLPESCLVMHHTAGFLLRINNHSVSPWQKKTAASLLEQWMNIAQYAVWIVMYICAKLHNVLLESKKHTGGHTFLSQNLRMQYFYITFSLLSKTLVVSDTPITAQSSSYIRPPKRLNGTMIWRLWKSCGANQAVSTYTTTLKTKDSRSSWQLLIKLEILLQWYGEYKHIIRRKHEAI